MSANAPPPVSMNAALPTLPDPSSLSQHLSSASPDLPATLFPIRLPPPPPPTKKRPRPRISVPSFDFVPPSNVSSLPTSFYPRVLSAKESDALVGLWRNHALSACASRRGSRRAQNEDRVFCDHANSIYGVCDGHGVGAVSQAPTEQLAADTVRKLLPSMLLTMPVCDAFHHIDGIVLGKLDDRSVVGTTVALVRIFQSTRVMQVAHVGDSRVVVIAADGTARTLTVDHSPSRPDEMQRIEQGGGYVLRGRVNDILAVSRAIGDSLVKYVVPPTPDVTKYVLRDDDQLVVIGTDGLWDLLSDAQVGAVCREMALKRGSAAGAAHLQQTADAILAKAAQFGRGDDATVVVVDVRKDTCF
ncbi:unnamed protein product [Agarophyton chilense]